MRDRLCAVLVALGRDLLAWREAGAAGGEADRLAHIYLCRSLPALDPVPVLSEEDEGGRGDIRPPWYWLIDPIDGTASWAGGYSGFVIQAALMRGGEPVLSAVHAPRLGLTYSAERGRGAWLGAAALRIDTGPSARLCLIDNWPCPRGSAAKVYEVLGCTDYIESGSIGLKICRVADGTADFFFKDVTVRDWDIAAPALVLAEAGGVLTALDGHPFRFVGEWEKPGVIAARSRSPLDAYVRAFHG